MGRYGSINTGIVLSKDGCATAQQNPSGDEEQQAAGWDLRPVAPTIALIVNAFGRLFRRQRRAEMGRVMRRAARRAQGAPELLPTCLLTRA